MPISALSPAFGAARSLPTSSPASPSNSSQLGQADFFKLLLAQMQNQDPLNPTSSSDFVAQLAQFSNLSAVQQLNTSFAGMLALQQLTQGANLIGKSITFLPPGGTQQTGNVDSVKVQNGSLQLMVGGNAVPLNQVTGVVQK
jgi:flagellar basal-body rod modification protein FlgD